MELIAHSRVSRHQDMTAAIHWQLAHVSWQLYVCVIYIVRNLKGALKQSKKLLYISNQITCIRQNTKSHIERKLTVSYCSKGMEQTTVT